MKIKGDNSIESRIIIILFLKYSYVHFFIFYFYKMLILYCIYISILFFLLKAVNLTKKIIYCYNIKNEFKPT